MSNLPLKCILILSEEITLNWKTHAEGVCVSAGVCVFTAAGTERHEWTRLLSAWRVLRTYSRLSHNVLITHNTDKQTKRNN